MADESLSIAVQGGKTVSAVVSTPSAPARWVFVYAPGAGAGLTDGFGVYAAGALANAGLTTLRFQFPYREAERSAPDRPPVLEATWRAALAIARPLAPRLVAGGRSMGGRIASRVAAQDCLAKAVMRSEAEQCPEPVEGHPERLNQTDALALFAYPLYPPGRPEQRRDGHLASITVPALFCSGDRDTYSTPAELATAAALLPNATQHVLAGADHGFNVLKSSGRARTDVWREAVETLLVFLDGVT